MNIIHGDCLEVMHDIPSASIDLILCDLPYGTTYARWDSLIPVEFLWHHYERIIKPNGAIVLFAVQPFTSLLITSNLKLFKYQWVWNKENASNFANAKRMPLKQHEDILVFYRKQPTYNPQMTFGKPNHIQGSSTSNKSETRLINGRASDNLSGMKYPKSILNFPKHSSQLGLHPTQKPVALCEYLIKTYTNEGDYVLDNCAGSGSTGIAAQLLGRNCTLIEKEQKYIDIINKRFKKE